MAPLVRQNIWSLQSGTTWHPIVLAYAQAVRVMKSRPASDPTSWAFQAAIHASFTSPAHLNWNKCQHRSWLFLPWHRMYLWFFENIVRAAVPGGAPADFALPYWNFELASPADTLPMPCRQPATLPDGSPNPLILGPGMRRQAMVNGSAINRTLINSTSAMSMTHFVNPPGPGFGGGDMRRNHVGQGTSGEVEANPHNPVHGAVGGPFPPQSTQCTAALMTHPRCAALDPVFWLHHANIDRLWNRWLQGGPVQAIPGNTAWLNESFTFHNESGAAVPMKVADVLDSATQLNYVYDDVPAVPVPATREVVTEPAPLEFVGASEESLELVDAPVSVPIAIRGEAERVAGAASRVLLRVENIEAERNSGLAYAVYVNLPVDAEAVSREQHLAGVVSLFGVEDANEPDSEHPSFNYVFDITDLVRASVGRQEWDPAQAVVTVEPFDPVVSGDEERAESFQQLPTVRIGRVSLFAE
jgi:hypothetical protein